MRCLLFSVSLSAKIVISSTSGFSVGQNWFLQLKQTFFWCEHSRLLHLEYRIAPHRQPAALHFENVIDDSRTHVMFVLPEEAPPCATLAEQFFKTCWKANCLSTPFLCWPGASSYAASDRRSGRSGRGSPAGRSGIYRLAPHWSGGLLMLLQIGAQVGMVGQSCWSQRYL